MYIDFYEKLNKNQEVEIKKLLEKCDNEFVPPLSSRKSTTQENLIDLNNGGIDDYLEAIKNQNFILAIHQGVIVGFMSFKKNYTCEHISNSYSINIYITTIIVDPEFRKRGISRSLYHYVLDRYKDRYIFTRTWSTNYSHISLLESLKFENYCTLLNDRGNNIHTLYFCK